MYTNEARALVAVPIWFTRLAPLSTSHLFRLRAMEFTMSSRFALLLDSSFNSEKQNQRCLRLLLPMLLAVRRSRSVLLSNRFDRFLHNP